jgi:predicted secreted protein
MLLFGILCVVYAAVLFVVIPCGVKAICKLMYSAVIKTSEKSEQIQRRKEYNAILDWNIGTAMVFWLFFNFLSTLGFYRQSEDKILVALISTFFLLIHISYSSWVWCKNNAKFNST